MTPPPLGTETDIDEVIAKQCEIEPKLALSLRIQHAVWDALQAQTTLFETAFMNFCVKSGLFRKALITTCQRDLLAWLLVL